MNSVVPLTIAALFLIACGALSWDMLRDMATCVRQAFDRANWQTDYQRGHANAVEFLAENPGPVDVLVWWNNACSDLDFNSGDEYARAVLDVLRDRVVTDDMDEMREYAL